MIKKKKKAVVLLSGGIDSTTTLYFAKSKGYDIFALIFDYNQRHRKEIKSAKRIAAINKAKYHIAKIDLGWTKSSLTKRGIKIPKNSNLNRKDIPSTYVAGRNIIFLSYAASLADSIGACKIFIGAHTQDYSGYPDCRPEFLQSFQGVVKKGLKSKSIKIVAPLINKSKKEIIKLGMGLGVPFEYTWSCYKGDGFPCGRCDSCRYRITAFKALGREDPLLRKKGGRL